MQSGHRMYTHAETRRDRERKLKVSNHHANDVNLPLISVHEQQVVEGAVHFPVNVLKIPFLHHPPTMIDKVRIEGKTFLSHHRIDLLALLTITISKRFNVCNCL